MRIAVAGGTGFVGGAIAEELVRRGHEVTVLSHRPRLPAALPAGAAYAWLDVTAPGKASLPDGLDGLVIALAFRGYPMENPRRGETFMARDAEGTERFVALARAAGVQRLLYLSGAGAAADAKEIWFRAKWRAETAVRESGIPYTIIRPTWLYGPRDAALNRFVRLARRLPLVPMPGDGRQPLAPVFIDDLAALAADALVADAALGQTFELGGPAVLTLDEIVHTALRIDGHDRPIAHAPARLMKVLAWPLQFLPRPPLTPAAIDFVNQPATVDTGPLLAAMPRRLTPLAEGLARYLGPAAPYTRSR
jgi:NADH dehydrogenase